MAERSGDPFAGLPVANHLERIQEALTTHGVAVLQAPPGSGKTSLVPPAVHALNPAGLTVVLQPRRVATRAVARMLAQRLETTLGERVGYQIRFDTKKSARTRLLVVTEGVLTSWIQRDPTLEGVTAVILDEFHERSLQADLALAMLKEVRETLRPDLLLMVMSATLDAGPISTFLNQAPIISCAVSTHPLEITYSSVQDRRNLDVRVCEAVLDLIRLMETGAAPNGHILVFLPGVREIGDARSRLETRRLGFSVVELHGRQPPDVQDLALRPSAARRVILSTNIAQTSLTIDGVTAVVDCGLAKQSELDPQTGLMHLRLVKISKASATQRAGRAGRQGPGRAIRLWSEVDEVHREPFDSPEIRRQDLSALVLDLKAWGCTDVSDFDFFEAPPVQNLNRAIALLQHLGALESEHGRLTNVGRAMRDIPAHPRVARMLVEATHLGVRAEASDVAALLLERKSPSHIPGHDVGYADVLVWYRAERERGTFRSNHGIGRLSRRLSSQGPKSTMPEDQRDAALCRCLFVGWPDQLALRPELTDPTLALVGGRRGRLIPQSVVRDSNLLIALHSTLKDSGETMVRSAVSVEREWLEEHPGFSEAEVLVWEPDRLRVAAYRQRSFLGLRLSRQPAPLEDEFAVAELLADRMSSRLVQRLATEPDILSFIRRIELVSKARPELDYPVDISAWFMSRAVEFCVGCRSWDEVKQRQLVSFIRDALSWPQREALEEGAPTKLRVPSGRMVTLNYPSQGAPILAVKVQEVFGWASCPSIAGGQSAVVLHLLDPAGRPLQVTQDLSSFWTNTWGEVRKEMRRRYPKHRWPEDPATAQPSTKTTRPR